MSLLTRKACFGKGTYVGLMALPTFRLAPR